MRVLRKLILFIGLMAFGLYIGFKLYQKLYAYEYYPSGRLKKSAAFVLSNGLYRIKEYYENGNLESIYYKKDLITQGIMHIYREDGRLKALNYFKDGRMYYKKVYDYNSSNELIDSAYSIVPLIYNVKRDTAIDSIYYKVGVITDGLNISYDSLDLFYELYEYKIEGMMPYTPSHVAPLKDCAVQDLRLSTKPNMILLTDNKPDSLYFFVLVRDKVNGKLHENDAVILPMKW